MFEVLLTPGALFALLTLTLLEIVLGIDNIIFISIITGKLPAAQQRRARVTGLVLAMIMRLGLLMAIGFILSLDKPLFELPFALPSTGTHSVEGATEAPGNLGLSIKDLLLLAGGLFLVAKSVSEIHGKMEGEEHAPAAKGKSAMSAAIVQIILVDLVFSFDSILTAVGLTDIVPVMMIAVVLSMIVMLIFSGGIARFINKHPTFQILALSFLILIGFTLIVEGLHVHVAKGYVYFSVAFALAIEVVNLRVRKKSNPVQLRQRAQD